MGIAYRYSGFAGLPWDLESIGAAASLVGGAIAMLARAVTRRKVLDVRVAWIAVRAIRIAAGSSRTMLISYRLVKGRWLATIVAENCADGHGDEAGAPSIAAAFTDQPVDDDYVRHVIQPFSGSDEVLILTDDLEEGSTLRRIYLRDGTASSLLLLVDREDDKSLRLVSVNRRSTEPIAESALATVEAEVVRIREAVSG